MLRQLRDRLLPGWRWACAWMAALLGIASGNPAVLTRKGAVSLQCCLCGLHPGSALSRGEALPLIRGSWVHTCSIGVVAVALASGAVQVLTVPRTSLAPAGTTAPQVARLQPHACADAPGGSGGSLVSTLEWLATAPHNLLLVRATCWQ